MPTQWGGVSLNLTGYQKTDEKGDPNGYPSLDGGGKVPEGQLPAQSGPSAVVDYADATDYTKGQFIRTGLGRLYVVWIDFTSTGDLDADLDAYCDGTYILAQQGGFTRQVLVKQSATDFDVSYASPRPLLYTSIPVGSWVLRDSLVTPTLGAGTVYVATNQFVSTGVWNDDKVNLLAVSVPAGGTTAQVLTKASNADGDADWEDAGGATDSLYTFAFAQAAAGEFAISASEIHGSLAADASVNDADGFTVPAGTYVGTIKLDQPGSGTIAALRIGPNRTSPGFRLGGFIRAAETNSASAETSFTAWSNPGDPTAPLVLKVIVTDDPPADDASWYMSLIRIGPAPA